MMMVSHHKEPHNAVVDLTKQWLSESYTEQRTGIDCRTDKTLTINNTKASVCNEYIESCRVSTINSNSISMQRLLVSADCTTV